MGWILLELVVLGVLIWVGNGFISSALAGWSALSRQFPASHHPTDAVLRACVLGIGSGPGVANLLDPARTRAFGLLARPNGLYLDAGSPTRFRWPPLLIPWIDVRLIATRDLLGRTAFELRLGQATTYLCVNQTAFDQIAPFLTQTTAAQQAVAADGRAWSRP
jgi:hypothetical protein